MNRRRRWRSALARTSLGLVAACLAGPLRGAAERAEAAGTVDWVQSPYRHFRPGEPVAAGRAVLFDEADDPSLREGLSAEIGRLEGELFERQGWRSPFPAGEPLRVYVARGESGGVRTLSARGLENGRFVAPEILLDASKLGTPAIVREVSRQVARATLAGYGVDDSFLLPALAEHLSASPGELPAEEVWIAAAAGRLDFRGRPEALGRLWVDEVSRAARTPGFLRDAWQRAAELSEEPIAVLLRSLGEETDASEEAVLVRAAARLYAAIEPEASPARLRLFDVENGAIDAAAPPELEVRHRTLLPESEESLRIAWPTDGASGAAVVRYRDAALPPDVVFFAAGERRTIPLSGVARVDWLVAGSAEGGRGLAAPASAEVSRVVPYAGLEAQAQGGSGGPRLTWTTASHEGLWGWAVFREEVLADGRIARTGPELVPSAENSSESYRYEFVDSTSRPGTYYRYTVWAVTADGLLDRAFSTTVRTAD